MALEYVSFLNQTMKGLSETGAGVVALNLNLCEAKSEREKFVLSLQAEVVLGNCSF